MPKNFLNRLMLKAILIIILTGVLTNNSYSSSGMNQYSSKNIRNENLLKNAQIKIFDLLKISDTFFADL